jgi:hypothetical protein
MHSSRETVTLKIQYRYERKQYAEYRYEYGNVLYASEHLVFQIFIESRSP